MKELKKNMTSFNVMLAKEFDPMERRLDIKNFIQPKLDGVRCYITKDGAFSRNHKPFKNCKHITTTLQSFFKDYPDRILDGELYNHKFKNDFNKIISLVKKQKPTQADRFESAMYLQFHCYDQFIPDSNIDTHQSLSNFINFQKRSERITAYKEYYKWRSIKTVPTYEVTSDTEIRDYHNEFKDLGYEGSILRYNTPYETKRSNNLMKIKDWSDTEATITGYVEGRGKFANGLGKWLAVDKDGREVEIPWPTLTIENRKQMWQARNEYIGKLLTFEFFERTPAGAYRFPRAKTIRNYE